MILRMVKVVILLEKQEQEKQPWQTKLKHYYNHISYDQYKFAIPTHNSSLYDSQSIHSLFNINQHNHTHPKSAVDELKS